MENIRAMTDDEHDDPLAAQQALRADLACALRWCAKLDMHEGVANHFSVALDDEGHEFLINPAGKHFSQVCAGDLILADALSTSQPDGIDPTAWHLHGYFHQHLPQARCLMHTHSPYATALACLDGWQLRAIDQNSSRFHNRVAYDEEFGGMLLADEECERQCKLIGSKPILLMRGHGVLVCAPDVATAFDLAYYFERACRTIWLAMSTGQPLFEVDDETAEKTAQQWEAYPNHLHFAELKRMLFAESPSFQN